MTSLSSMATLATCVNHGRDMAGRSGGREVKTNISVVFGDNFQGHVHKHLGHTSICQVSERLIQTWWSRGLI